MSVLALVRHAQASFFTDDYDRLSPVGVAQARELAAFWARASETFDEVYVGPRRRQRQTVETVAERYRQAGLDWPEAVVMPELDEYDITGLLSRLVPSLAQRDSAFEELVAAYHDSGEQHRGARFQRMFEALLAHWQSIPVADAAVESWPAFRERVRQALERITDRPGRGRRAVAFTSGGFIGTAVSLVLDAPDRIALELNWRLRNCSITRLVFTPDRVSLDEFNTMPHLHDRDLWTYR
jgi:broad specificity phosphatase PhoE